MKLVGVAVVAAYFTSSVLALSRDDIPTIGSLSRPPIPPAVFAAAVTTGNATFSQPIDHQRPSIGNFSQQYWWSTQFWRGPGSPVILFTPGEANATGYQGYLTNRTLTGLLAQAVGGAVVMVEHRYWGNSSPYSSLTTQNMQYLTLNNSIADLVNFARNVQLPFDKTGSSVATKAPWVLSGGSYSGALTAWTEQIMPGTFWAYHATSAPVEAISDYWQYFVPVQQGMPQNCSKDVSLVIDYVDSVLTTGTAEQVTSLKTMFGLQGVVHNDDFAAVLPNGPWLWQGNQMYTNSGFFAFCDAVENADTKGATIPGADGVGLEKALAGYARWVNSTMLPGYCASYGYWTDEWSIDCFDTYNKSSSLFTDTSLSNAVDRQWQWFLCNEPFGYWQDGAPTSRPSIVSRLITPSYWKRQCALFFPPTSLATYGYARGRTEELVNAATRGWDLADTTRLIWANGQFDPWRTAGVSSEFRPGGPLPSTPQAPVNVIPGGFHCTDLIARNGAVNSGVQAVIDAEVAQVKAWVALWPGGA